MAHLVAIPSGLERIAEKVHGWAEHRRRTVAHSLYSALAASCYLLAFLLRFDLSLPAAYAAVFVNTVGILIGVRFVVNHVFGLSTGRWRFVSIHDVLRLVLATSAGSILFALITLVLPADFGIPRSVVLIEWLLTTLAIGSLWVGYRTGYEQLRHFRSGFNGNARDRKSVV